MAEENKNLQVEETEDKQAKVKVVEKKPNFFVRVFTKIKKFCKDVAGEMKKVVWTSKEDLKKSTKVVLVTVVAVAVAIAIVDVSFSWIINSIAALFG